MEGPKGKLSMRIHPDIKVSIENNTIKVESPKLSSKLLPFTAALYPSPTTSSPLVNPSVTPIIIFQIRAAVVPCMALWKG